MYADGMDLRQLEIIRAIADSGSFTAAGEKLHVSQSAISRQILLLEDELGEPVFHRIGRRIRITPAGESLLQLSHRVFQDLHDTVSAISDKRESLKGNMRLVGGMTDEDFNPTAAQMEVLGMHMEAWASLRRTADQLRASEVPAFNRRLAESGVPHVIGKPK